MTQIKELKSKLQTLCDISAEDAEIPAEILSKVVGIFSENKVLRAKIDDLKTFSAQLITRLEDASRNSERTNLLESQIEDLRGQNSDLKNSLQQNADTIQNLKNELSEKERQISNLSRQISTMDSQLVALRQNYDQLETIRQDYENLDIKPYYEKLSDELKSYSLSNVFVRTDNVSLLSSGIQETNIKNIYEILANRVKEENWDHYEELNEFITRLFNLYNQGRKEPYIIINPDVDTETNDNEHIVKNGSSGKISKVLLFGYKTQKGIVQKKAFVEIR